MRALMKVGFSLLMLAFVLIGVSFSMIKAQGGHSPSNPAGRVVESETRAIGNGIVVVQLNGPIDLTLTRGPVPALSVRGEQRMLGNIVTTQEGNTVRIGTKGVLLLHRQPLQLDLALPALERLELNGSGDSTVNGFSGDKFQLEVNGAGNVVFNGRFKNMTAGLHGSGDLELNSGDSERVALELAGSGKITAIGNSKALDAELTGSGDLDAKHLSADTCSVQMQGSGTAEVRANEVANLTLRGSGDLTVHGNPGQRSVTRSGSGEVSWQD